LGVVTLGWAGVALTLAWVVFATNAMNFIDGLNGLASGVTLIACLFLAVIAVATGGWFAYAMAGLLAAGVLGFVPFNFPRARIFMGDVGSQFCGFMLAQLAIVASRFDGVELSFLLVPMLLFGVLYDVAFTLCRRAWQGERVTEGHRGHLYQIANRAGLSATRVSLIHWGFAAWGGLACVIFMAVGSAAKPFVPLLVLAPQLIWTWLVRAWAARAGVGRWG
jgi:UDP-GlcNAc:undecaprenyl-phosphate GlcNAc-1-phosphate transferase